MKVIERTIEPLDRILDFYKSQGYGGGAREEDKIFLAYESNHLICVLRVAIENDVPVLRGMYMKEEMRGEGKGKKILKHLEPYLNKLSLPCFCIPKSHLARFYGTIGFRVISPHEPPDFLRKRFCDYLNEGYDVVLMKRE